MSIESYKHNHLWTWHVERPLQDSKTTATSLASVVRFPGHAHNNLAVSLDPGEVRRSLQMACSEFCFLHGLVLKVKRLQQVEQSSEGSQA